MAQTGHLKGEILRMKPLNAYARRQVVGDRTGGRCTAIDEFQGDGGGMGEGVQLKANQDGGVQEAVRGPRVDQRLDGNRRLTRNEKVDKKGKIVRTTLVCAPNTRVAPDTLARFASLLVISFRVSFQLFRFASLLVISFRVT